MICFADSLFVPTLLLIMPTDLLDVPWRKLGHHWHSQWKLFNNIIQTVMSFALAFFVAHLQLQRLLSLHPQRQEKGFFHLRVRDRTKQCPSQRINHLLRSHLHLLHFLNLKCEDQEWIPYPWFREIAFLCFCFGYAFHYFCFPPQLYCTGGIQLCFDVIYIVFQPASATRFKSCTF